jgi:hypothetical protein
MVGYPEVILGRYLLAGELEICWAIPASPVSHRIAGRAPHDKTSYRNASFCLMTDSTPHFENPASQEMSPLENNCFSGVFPQRNVGAYGVLHPRGIVRIIQGARKAILNVSLAARASHYDGRNI